MRVLVNGEEAELNAGTTIQSLVARLELTTRRVAVELNQNVIARSEWPLTVLEESDRVEIVHFVGGG